MGTNFYALIPLKDKTKEAVQKLLNNIVTSFKKANTSTIEEIEEEVFELKEQLKKLVDGHKIHLGKRSAGWSFCWDANELKYYKPSLKSIHKWIVDNNAIIKDEYGEDFSWDEFINEEIGYCLYSSKAVKSVEELPDGMNPDTVKYLKDNYFDKNLPCFQYCSHRTYHIMFPDEPTYYYSNSHPDFTPYTKNGFVDEEFQEFHSKDGLRFVTYTNFS